MSMFLKSLFFILILAQISCLAQKQIPPPVLIGTPMTPERLWTVKRVTGLGLTRDGNNLVYRVSTPDVEADKMRSSYYMVPVTGGPTTEIPDASGLAVKELSPDGKYKISTKEVKTEQVRGTDYYPELKKSNAWIYNALDYRHWDTWNDGTYNHLFFGPADQADSTYTDLLQGMPYNCPQKPFGGDDDYVWSPDGKSIVYVAKKLAGTASVVSTNTDLYRYELATGITTNLTEQNKGYDTNPQYSIHGDLAYLSMQTDGYEADKNDLKVIRNGKVLNLTSQWDETVLSYRWANDGRRLWFTAAVDGTLQVFEVNVPQTANERATVRQVTQGDWDVNTIIGESGDLLIVNRVSINRAAELFSYNTMTKTWRQLTDVNGEVYNATSTCRTERRYVTTSDQKKMLVWVVYPPDFDPNKKYPTLLYCQGGPQSALTQFYSFRWNLHLMASQGYIVVAPNRRGMPGHGVEWNRQISKDWGGQNIRDYLSAIDDMSAMPYVDRNRLGAVGASYGGYSVFYLAGVHNKRFRSFIAHDGMFNTQSMYGTTEEMFFVNYDLGGPYWDPANRKSYVESNPSALVAKWDTPILIIQGGKDYRVPEGQGIEAFTAAQLRGIKSRFLFLPEENHWVTRPQNSLVWQREFFKWLKETL